MPLKTLQISLVALQISLVACGYSFYSIGNKIVLLIEEYAFLSMYFSNTFVYVYTYSKTPHTHTNIVPIVQQCFPPHLIVKNRWQHACFMHEIDKTSHIFVFLQVVDQAKALNRYIFPSVKGDFHSFVDGWSSPKSKSPIHSVSI